MLDSGQVDAVSIDQQLLHGLDDGAHYVHILPTRMRLDASHKSKYVALAQLIEFLRQSTTINSKVMQMISLGTDHAGMLFCCIRLWIMTGFTLLSIARESYRH